MIVVKFVKIVAIRISLCILFLSLALVSACGSKPDPKKAIIGKWMTNMGKVVGLGNVVQTMEFFDNGTVTSRTDITNFVGNYQFLDDDTVRIDWKEQGLFGHSPTQIFDAYPDDDNDVLIMVNDASREVHLYLGESQLRKTRESVADEIATELPEKIIGTWIPFSCSEEQAKIASEQYSVEFLRDGTTTQGEYSVQSNMITVNNMVYEVWYISDNRIIANTGSQDNRVYECWYKM
jgi:hypothetical protein